MVNEPTVCAGITAFVENDTHTKSTNTEQLATPRFLQQYAILIRSHVVVERSMVCVVLEMYEKHTS